MKRSCMIKECEKFLEKKIAVGNTEYEVVSNICDELRKYYTDKIQDEDFMLCHGIRLEVERKALDQKIQAMSQIVLMSSIPFVALFTSMSVMHQLTMRGAFLFTLFYVAVIMYIAHVQRKNVVRAWLYGVCLSIIEDVKKGI